MRPTCSVIREFALKGCGVVDLVSRIYFLFYLLLQKVFQIYHKINSSLELMRPLFLGSRVPYFFRWKEKKLLQKLECNYGFPTVELGNNSNKLMKSGEWPTRTKVVGRGLRNCRLTGIYLKRLFCSKAEAFSFNWDLSTHVMYVL